jgi:hypothetical protein
MQFRSFRPRPIGIVRRLHNLQNEQMTAKRLKNDRQFTGIPLNNVGYYLQIGYCKEEVKT